MHTPSQTSPPSEQDPPVPTKVAATVKAPKYDVEEAQNVVFKPNPGPQSNFLSASEREVLYGGSAGGKAKVPTVATFL